MNKTIHASNVTVAVALLGLLLVSLKLCHVIHWSWWLVCIPFLMLAAAALALIIIIAGMGIIAELMEAADRRRELKADLKMRQLYNE